MIWKRILREKRKEKIVKRSAAKTKAVKTDPFAAEAVETPVKKPAVKKAAAPAAMAKGAEKPVKKKPIVETAKTITADPFAEVAEATSPVKKRAVKTAKETARAVKAEAKPVKKTAKKAVKKATLDETAAIAAAEPKVELSPVFKALAEPTLPELDRENRARLQMQTPTRLYFYWSVKENPWAMLKSVFGDDMGSYSLVVKLIDRNGYESIHQTDAAGNYWFDVEPDGSYRAEIGFYAPNRPYFRILHSNTVETPRRSPSPRAATESDWTVSANKFAEVLDVAGFTRDAFDVAMAGDDPGAAQDASQTAFTSFMGTSLDLSGISAEDIRYALLALAAGATLEDLRFKVSAALFAVLQANAGSLVKEKAMSALTEHFDIEEAEFTEEQYGAAVYGASLVNFPKTLKTRTISSKGSVTHTPRYDPVSSHSFK
ncbi:hypothetical protein BH10ACI3_BH10ACI3_27380 [soil metagenome]